MIYLNNAATSYPKPEPVIGAVTACLTSPPVDPRRAASASETEGPAASCRAKLAALLNVENSNNIMLTSGATHSINVVLRGLDLKDAHVVTTSIEHSAVLRVLKLREQEDSLTMSIVECDGRGRLNPDDFADQIRPDTRAIVVSHASNVVNAVSDIESISEIAHDRQILLVVDASQSAGNVPIDVRKTDPSALIFTGHKSLYGIGGTGGFYLKEDVAVKPLIVGGTGVKSHSLFQTEERPVYYESGTQNSAGIAALEAGVTYVLDTGIDRLNEKKEKLYYKLTDALLAIPEVILYGEHRYSLPVVSFNLKNCDAKKAGYLLRERYDIVVRTGLCCAPLIHRNIQSDAYGGVVRASYSSFTTEEEIDSFIAAIKEINRLVKSDQEVVFDDGGLLSCY